MNCAVAWSCTRHPAQWALLEDVDGPSQQQVSAHQPHKGSSSMSSTCLITSASYCRFNAVDLRCGMALDAIDPAQWALLEAATDEYIQQEDARLDEVSQLLLRGLDGPLSPGLQHIRCGAPSPIVHRLQGVSLR